MSSSPTRRHRSFRFSGETLRRLDERAHEIRETRTALAERYVEEGLRMDEHPGIGFADGPAGRRAILLGTGLDVWARERVEMHGLSDRELLGVATGERRAVVTENVADFAELHRQSVLAGDPHVGLVFTSPRRFPRTRRGIGKLVRALEGLLTEGRPELEGQTWWL
jgi:hypothetical protein